MLKNTCESNVVFKIMTTNPSNYLVNPNEGVLEPDETLEV
jgi:hypothetical protein